MESKNLTLKDLSALDREELYRLHVLPFIENNTNLKQEDLQNQLKEIFKQNDYAVLSKDKNEIIGIFNYDIYDKIAILNYHLKPEYQEHTYALEMLEAITQELFNKGVEEIRTGYFAVNEINKKLLERCGFKYMFTSKRMLAFFERPINYCVYALRHLHQNQIIRLLPENYQKCMNIWNFQRQQNTKQFYQELVEGNRIIFVYVLNNEYVGEGSLVLKSEDKDYTIPNQRINITRLIVKPEYRRRGIATKLAMQLLNTAREMGYQEATIGIDLKNHVALHLYEKLGFNHILYRGRDQDGEFIKLLKKL